MLDTQDLLSQINIYNKYARFINSENRRESWQEICERVMAMHIDRYSGITDDIVKAFSFVKEKKILPSMRSLQFAGLPIDLNPTRMYNCSYLAIDNYKAFSEIFFLLLSGTGVGFSVQKHHIAKLPPIKKAIRKTRFLIPDSIEGWSETINRLIKGYFGLSDTFPVFDYRDIRPQGSALKTSGGKAPGSEPLKVCLEKIDLLLSSKKEGEKLSTLEVHDIICHIADAVLAGGVRRSATISLFSKDDHDMLTSKSGNWWENNLQRARANNSVVLDRNTMTKEEFFELWKIIEQSQSGEPGIFFTNDFEMGTNPCAEISLSNYGFCNLVEINAGNITSQDDLQDRVKAGALIATLQAGYTDFHFLRDAWKKQAELDAQIGVSLTGIADGSLLNYNLKQAAQSVLDENARIAGALGMNLSVRCTTVKPSGNSSIVLKTSSGVHARHAPYYLRRMRIGKFEAIYQYLSIKAPYLLEDDLMNPNEAIVKVAVKSPNNAIFRDETPIQFLERVKFLHDNWIQPGHRSGANTNNVSATCSIKSDQWDMVGEWMWNNRFSYNGISVLPYDGGSYPQLPFEECSQQDYENFVAQLKGSYLQGRIINLDEIIEYQDNTNLQGEAACAGGACELF
ncbi:MAG: hypothetical protein ACRCTQ_05925 [Brevinemataceae bacterium]